MFLLLRSSALLCCSDRVLPHIKVERLCLICLCWQVLNAHSSRKMTSKAAFRSVDSCESGVINDYMLEKYI